MLFVSLYSASDKINYARTFESLRMRALARASIIFDLRNVIIADWPSRIHAGGGLYKLAYALFFDLNSGSPDTAYRWVHYFRNSLQLSEIGSCWQSSARLVHQVIVAQKYHKFAAW